MEIVRVQKTDYGVSEFLQNFTSESTRRAYKADIESFFLFLSSKGVFPHSPSDVKTAHFITYRDYLRSEGQSPTTLNRKISTLKSLWSWFETNGHISVNPAVSIKVSKTSVKKPTQAFTDEEVNKMLDCPDDTFHGRIHYMIMLLLFYTGMRRSELCNLKVKDIQKEGDYLIFRILGKGDKLRELPIPELVQLELKSYIKKLKLNEDDFLIQSRENEKNQKPYNATTMYKVIKRYAKRCNINKQVSPHSCRATVITKSLENGAPITEVADLAGHESINTTQLYWKRRQGLKSSPIHKLNY